MSIEWLLVIPGALLIALMGVALWLLKQVMDGLNG